MTMTLPTPPLSAREQFDRQAAQYNERWASWSDEALRRMLELANPQPNWRVLDVATGTGFTALAFASQVAEVVGTDISPGMLTEAAKRARSAEIANVRWQEAPAEALPFDNGTFDLVTCRIAPHHFTSVPMFLSEVARVLAPGGVFVLGDTTVPSDDPEAAEWQNAVERERDPSHMRNRSPEEWLGLCILAGFTVTNLDHSVGAITMDLSAWLDTSGCEGERAERVRQLFAEAPASARQQFRIETDADSGETWFSWQRVILRAVQEN
jgi:ubiquinone/menaquinone biosynthesis C-methylase UbiE